jgi:hypothetical protein
VTSLEVVQSHQQEHQIKIKVSKDTKTKSRPLESQFGEILTEAIVTLACDMALRNNGY